MRIVFLLLFFSYLAHAEVGFHQLQEAGTPASVKAAQDEIFEIIAPGLPDGQDPKQFAVQGLSDSDLQNEAQSISQGRWRPDIRVPALVTQFKFCQAKQKNPCPYFDALVTSSAFVVKDPHLFVATFHGIARYVNLLKSSFGLSYQQMQRMSLPFALVDRNGRIVRSAAPGLTVQKLLPRTGSAGFDLSVFTAEDFPAAGIPLDSEPSLSGGENLYGVGYPGATTTRSALGKGDAQDDVLTWSQGHFTGSLGALAHTEFEDIMYSYDFSNLAVNPLIFADMDAAPGSSGEPILTDSGTVVGVVTNGVFPGGNEDQPPMLTVLANLLRALAPSN